MFQTETYKYEVKYFEESVDNETTIGIRYPEVSAELTGLKPDTCYMVIVCATNTAGRSPNSNSIFACTDKE